MHEPQWIARMPKQDRSDWLAAWRACIAFQSCKRKASHATARGDVRRAIFLSRMARVWLAKIEEATRRRMSRAI